MTVQTRSRRSGVLSKSAAVLALAGLGLLGAAGPALALGPGAPPVITSLLMWQEGGATVLAVGIDIPGGHSPRDVLSVELQTPSIPPARFNLGVERRDLLPEGSFVGTFNAFQSPPGGYTLLVTDVASGVTTLDFSFSTVVPLPAPTKLAIPGSIVVQPTGVRVVDLATDPRPTITFFAVPGALLHRVIVREANSDASAVELDLPGEGTLDDQRSVQLPAGVVVPSRRYVVTVYAFDRPEGFACPSSCSVVTGRTRAGASLEFITEGPELLLTTQGGAANGQVLSVNARVFNRGAPVTVNAFGWIGFTGGPVLTLFSVNGLAIPTSPAADFFDGPVLTHAFGPGDPAGPVVVGVRLVDAATGYTVAVATQTLNR